MCPFPTERHAASSSPSALRAGALVVALVLTGLVLGGVVAVGGGFPRFESLLRSLAHGDLATLRSQLRGMGPRAVLALIVLVLAHTVLPFPAELLEAAGGFALGVALGLPVLLASFLASAVLAYFIGFRVGRPLAAALVGSGRLQKAERIVERGGSRGLLAIRLVPLVPFSPLCIACGLARVPLRRYVWTTTLGLLPELTLVTFLGASLQSSSLAYPRVWVPLAGILVLVIVGPSLLRLSSALSGRSDRPENPIHLKPA